MGLLEVLRRSQQRPCIYDTAKLFHLFMPLLTAFVLHAVDNASQKIRTRLLAAYNSHSHEYVYGFFAMFSG